jgi:hypothetical protein
VSAYPSFLEFGGEVDFKSLAEAKEYLESYLNLKFNGKTQVWTGNGFKGNFWIDELAEEEIE